MFCQDAKKQLVLLSPAIRILTMGGIGKVSPYRSQIELLHGLRENEKNLTGPAAKESEQFSRPKLCSLPVPAL